MDDELDRWLCEKLDEHEEKLTAWDRYYLDICNVVASKSRCLSRQIGAIIVKDKVVVCTGYNGPPRSVPHCGQERIVNCYNYSDPLYNECINNSSFSSMYDELICPRQILGYKSGEGIHLCPAAHAERNAIDQAARLGISTYDTIMYMNCGVSCMECAKSIIQAGIKEIVIVEEKYYDSMSKWLFEKGNVIIRLNKTIKERRQGNGI